MWNSFCDFINTIQSYITHLKSIADKYFLEEHKANESGLIY